MALPDFKYIEVDTEVNDKKSLVFLIFRKDTNDALGDIMYDMELKGFGFSMYAGVRMPRKVLIEINRLLKFMVS